MITVNMGRPKHDWQEIPLSNYTDTLRLELQEEGVSDAVAVNMGNPHAVFFVEDITEIKLSEIGPRIETHTLFPERVNVEVAQIVNDKAIRLRVWERGAGETLACGTGACAALVAGASAWAYRPQGRCHAARWHAANLLAGGSRGRRSAHDRTGDAKLYRRDNVMTIDVLNFGCRLNAYESEVMRAHAQKAGLVNAILVNTCAVTNEAERQARQAIRKAKRANPGAQIIVSGCSAQVNPKQYADMPEVSHVLGNAEKLLEASYGFAEETKIQVNDIMSVRETALHLVEGFDGKARAYVQVQNGCDHRCTFCIIPYGRGNSRSVPVGEIVGQVRALVENGYKEIVLTGVDVSAYGEDLPGAPTLGQMMRRLLALVPELPRLRLSSIDAVEVDDELYRLLAEEPRLMPHLHISLQAGDDIVLKRMKRRHSRSQALEFCAKVRELRPDIVFGADIIAGFPTETDAMFENSLRMVEEAEITFLHVFPYSERPGTPAARMPQVPLAVRKERAAILRAAGKKQMQQYLHSAVGRHASALVEQDGLGRTEHFTTVKLNKQATQGSIVKVKITAVEDEHLQGEIAA